MRRHGRTAAGTPRWRCPRCRVSTVRRRPDTQRRHRRAVFLDWLLGMEPLRKVAERCKVTRQALTEWFEPFWREPLPVPRTVGVTGYVLIVDGVRLARAAWVLIGRTRRQVVRWDFVAGETVEAWTSFGQRIQGEPWAVVLDGRPSLVAAIVRLWPHTNIQRCHFHVQQRARQLLTTEPTTEVGRQAQHLFRTLSEVRTRRKKRRWTRAYRRWERRAERFLAERTVTDHRTRTGRRHWWYTHKKLRGVRSLIRNALPHLFTYVRHPIIPRTTNHVEGGLNSPFKDLMRRHRGLPLSHKQRLAALFFGSKQ